MAKGNTQENDLHERREWIRKDTLQIHSIGYLVTKPGWKRGMHSHEHWEFLYYIRGKGTFIYRDREFPVNPGDCFILPPEEEHRLKPAKGTSFDHVYMIFSISPFEIDMDLIPALGNLPPHVLDPLRRASDMVREEESDDVRPSTAAAVLQALSALIEYLQKNEEGDSRIGERRAAWIINKCKEFIEAHSSRALSVEELADSLYLTPHYTGQIFREQTGKTIKEYHTELRLARAVEMIRSGEYNLTEIAEELGFDTIHYFSRTFKKHYGVPPSEFS